ncbi:potassium/sodium hyperpolarization-activated cyclic nucleotide-gated channel 2-like [Actinia tenebrosa]|uniref:Potassium/sodium hyperpolarization-activated cyclic nucleotide-gated channel 2-like n=1 Tax=Actinia tenebrosa TaxID=6105 RepID=A0A6P8I8Y3_ACTTE|nr:potassium/sodium hyperpolarization-activated cyclic nucleotide-gated channel 2-like [Actinia tenebrosa]
MSLVDLNEKRCPDCGLFLPCHCKIEKKDFFGVEHHEEAVLEEPIVILHKRQKRYSYPMPGPTPQQKPEALTNKNANLLNIASLADKNASSFNMKKTTKARPLHYLKDLFSANPDNKLALKLFGNQAAVLLEQRRQTTKASGVIHPFSTFRWYWDILLVIFISLHVLLLPVNIAFLSDDLSLHWLVINGISDLFFLVDIFLNFRTGLVDPNNKDEVILDPAIIRITYLKGWFIIDLLSSLPFDYAYFIASSTSTEQTLLKASRALRILKLAKVLSLLRLLRVSRLVRYIKRFEELTNIAGGQLRIMKLIGCMMLLSHWNGCVQFLVPYLQGFPDESWVVINGLKDEPAVVQYSWSLFNAMSHMLCIGYGRYPPHNTTELWLTILSMTIGATFYAVFIGIMSGLVMSIDSSGRLYNEKFNQVEEYMRYRKLSLPLRLKVQEYYEHRFRHKLFNEDSILNELSKSLREEILVHNVHLLLSSVPFFSSAKTSFITDIVTKLHFEVYLPGEYICRRGRKGDKMYFIQKGIVDILTKDNELATSLGEGSHFGEICLLTKEARRVASVRAATICDLYSLSSTHFHEVLEEYPSMKEMLKEVAKERLSRIGLKPDLSGDLVDTSEDQNRPVFDSDPLQASCFVNAPQTKQETELRTDKNLPSITKKPADEPKPSSSWKPTFKLRKGALLTQAFVKSVAPGLVSLAQPSTDAPELQVVVEEPEKTERRESEVEDEDEDVVAMMADF